MRSRHHSELETKHVELPLRSTLSLDASLHDTRIFIDGLKLPVSFGLFFSCYHCYPGPDLDIVLMAYLHRLNYAHHFRPEKWPFSMKAQRSSLSVWSSSDRSDSHTAEIEPSSLFLNLISLFETWETLLGSLLHVLVGEAFRISPHSNSLLPATHPGLLPCLFHASRLTRFTNVSAMMRKNLLSQIQIMQPSGRIPFRCYTPSCSLMIIPRGELLIKRFFRSWRGDEMSGTPLRGYYFSNVWYYMIQS